MAHLLQYLSTDSRYVQTSVSNGMEHCNFSVEREVFSLSWDKGTTGQAQNLAKGRDETACQNPERGMGRYEILTAVPSRPTGQNGTEDILIQEMDILKQKKDVLKQEKDVLKQKRTF